MSKKIAPTELADNKLKKHRLLAGYDLKYVSTMIGIKKVETIEQWEDGLTMPDSSSLIRLIQLYKVDERKLYPKMWNRMSKEIKDRMKLLKQEKAKIKKSKK